MKREEGSVEQEEAALDRAIDAMRVGGLSAAEIVNMPRRNRAERRRRAHLLRRLERRVEKIAGAR